jgi:hypothetical protein
LWSNNATTPTITVSTQGTNTYTVTVTDACGTTKTASATVSLFPNPTATISGSGVFCTGVMTPINLNVNFTGFGSWDLTYNAAGTTVNQNFTSSPGTIVATTPGVYSLVSVTSQNGCTGTVSGTVTLQEVAVTLTQTPTNPTCFGVNNGSITSTASGGSGPFTYAWTPSGSGANQSNLGPGTYAVTVTNGNGCTATNEVTLTAPPELEAAIVGSNNIDCNNPTGNADLEVSGGTPGYTYNWSNGSSVQDPTFNAGGTFTVTVTDAKNCTQTASVTINANTTLPTATIAPPPQVTCANPLLTLNASGSSQGSNFTFQWSGPGFVCCENTLEPQIDQGGTYTITITNTENGCTKTASVTVVQNNTPPTAVIAPPPEIGCNAPTITISGNGSSAGAGITYQWTANPGNIVSGATTLNPQVNLAGTYTLVVTNTNNGCTQEATTTVTGDVTPPDAVIAPPPIINCYDPEITLDGSGSSQGSNFTYNWSGPSGGINSGGNTLNPSVDLAGTYVLTVTNSDNDCTATASVTVASNLTLPTAVAANPPLLTCTTTEVTISGNGSSTGPNFEYEWTTSGGNIVSGENTLNPIVDQPGSYTLVVTNTENGCTKSTTVTVQQNITPPTAIVASPPNIGCNLPVVTLSGNGSSFGAGFAIQWSTSGGNFTCCTNTLNPQVDQAGTYTLVVTNTNNGCTEEASVTVSGNTIVPTASITPPPIINCYDPEITLDGSGSSQGGNFTYNWSGPSGGINSGGNTLNPSVDVAGTYVLTVTDTDNDCTATASVTVASNLTLPTAVAANPPLLTCQNPELTLNGIGSSTGPNFEYAWTTVGGNIVSGETTLTPVIDAPGTYTLVVTNTENGCTKSVTVTVTANQGYPIANAGQSLELNCYTPTVQIQGSGTGGSNFSILWIANPGNIVSGGTTFTPTVNQPGTYTLLVTNTTNGCTAEDVVVITDNFNVPEAIIAPPSVLNCYNSSIEIDGSASSQGSNFTYNWASSPPGGITGGANSSNPTVNQPGTYFLTVTDTDSGCTASAQTTVTRDVTPPFAAAGPGGQLSCQMPTLFLNGNGSAGPNFTYQWSTPNGNILNGETTLTPEIDAGGIYLLTVTNLDNGCTASSSVTITVNQNFPYATGGPDRELNCQNNGVVELNGSGSSAGPNFSYQWTADPGNIVSGANTLKPKVNEEGVYTLVVTNTTNGCTDVVEVLVVNNIIYPEPFIADPQELNCNFPTVDLDAVGSVYNNTGAFLWTASGGGNIVSGATTLTPVVNQPGVYKLVITNEDNFCTASATVTVTKDITPPAAAATAAGVLTCQFPQLVLSGNGSSEGPAYFYEWTTANGHLVSGEYTLTPTVDKPGVYQLTVFNINNGCTRVADVSVSSSQVFPASNAGTGSNLTCTVNQITLSGVNSSTGSQYAYTWTTPNGNIVSGGSTLNPIVDAPGVYDLVVINLQNGCTAVSTVSIDTDYTLPQAITAPGGTLSCTQTTLLLNGSGSSAGQPFSYSWTTTTGNIISGSNTLNPTVNAIGNYQLLVTNTTNGCTATSTTQVTADAGLPTVTAGQPDTLTCSITQITLNTSGSSTGPQYQYEWSGPGIVDATNLQSPVVNAPGQYTLTITNTGNGCTALSAVNIAQDIIQPLAEAGPGAQLDCNDLTATLEATHTHNGGNYVYQWITNDGNMLSGANTLNPVVNQPGTYTLYVRNSFNNCLTTDSVVITRDIVNPLADAGQPGLITCTNPTVTLGGTGSTGNHFQYAWTSADGNIASGANSLSPVVDAPGTYTLVITNLNNDCTATDAVVVVKDANVPTAQALVTGELNCIVKSLTLSGGGSTQGANIITGWTASNGGNIVSGGNSLTPLINAPGTYTLEIWNTTNNCKAFSSVQITENLTPPVAQAGAPTIISCLNPVITLNGSGSSSGNQYTYLWTTPDGQLISGENTTTPTVDQSGFYTILVTDQSNGCTATSTVQIVRDQNTPEADAGLDPELSCVVSSLSLNGNGSSSGPQFSFLWSTVDGFIASGANSLNPTITAPGTYSLTVSNAQNGCTSVDYVNVSLDVAPPLVDAGTAPLLTCALTSVTLNATAQTANGVAAYAWSTTTGTIVSGGNTLAPVVSDPGVYTVLVTDLNNGCTATASLLVPEDITPPASAAAVDGELTCAVQTIPLSGAGSSTGNNFSYSWTTGNGLIVDGNTTLTPSVSKPGIYTLRVTNMLTGCTTTAAVLVTQQIIKPTADAGANTNLSCAITSLSLTGSGAGGVSGVSFLWTGPGIVSGATTPAPTINQSGTYYLQVTDLYNGCVSKDSVRVIPNTTPPVVAVAAPDILTCLVEQVFISGQGSSSGSQFSYNWTGPGLVSGTTALSPLVNAPGIYQLTITNTGNGCTTIGTVVVGQDVVLPVAEAGSGFELTCSINQGSLSAAGSSSGPNFIYQWSGSGVLTGGSGLSPLVNAEGQYTLTVTNTTTGCKSTDVVVVTRNTNYPSDILLATDPPACDNQPGSIVFSVVQGGVGPYLYSIDGGQTFGTLERFENLPPGTYRLVVQDINGCEYEETLVFPLPVEPEVGLPGQIGLEFGESATLTALLNIPLSQVDTIIWAPMETITLTDKPHVVLARPFSNTEYTVTIINVDGCEDRATIQIAVANPNIWAPNVISPDADFNSTFLLFARDKTVRNIRSLQIYDRWGNQVFFTENILPNIEKLGWDGRFRDVPMNPAVFVWWAEVELESGQLLLLKGDVTIVR